MGLDITYYRKLATAENVELEDGYPVDYQHFVKFGASMEWSESEWPGRGAPLDPSAVYSFADSGSFRAGSYGGYNAWRRQLEVFADGTADFSELIDFADNEGTIGSIVSAKLATDFAKNYDRAKALGHEGETWFFEKYQDWQKAFETAADGGAVNFH
jgi:hypothetical protein